MKRHVIICSCPECAIDFSITTTNYKVSEELGTPSVDVFCPICRQAGIVDDKEDWDDGIEE
jgi:hypothetical protein